MKKLNYFRMQNVTKDNFEIDGVRYRKPTTEEWKKQRGTSANGIWQIFTDGKFYFTVYMKDILRVNHAYATLLFH